MEIVLFIAIGSALGGMARYGLSGLISHHAGASFPWGTLVVNVLGCLTIGLFFGWTGTGVLFLEAPPSHQVATYGFLGGFTTFSSFSLEALNLAREGERRMAAGYVLGTTVLGIAAVGLGFSITS